MKSMQIALVYIAASLWQLVFFSITPVSPQLAPGAHVSKQGQQLCIFISNVGQSGCLITYAL